MIRRLLLVLVLGLAVLSGCGVVTEMVVYPQSSHVGPAPSDLGARTVEVPSRAGEPLAAWWIDAAPGAPTVVLLHGVTDSRRRMIPRARLLRDAGFAVLVVDGRGHGESPGDAVEYGWRERFDAEACVAFVRRERPGTRVGVVGISLGGAGAALASEHLDADAVVLESVFSTFETSAGNRVERFLGPLGRPILSVLRPSMEARFGTPLDAIAPIVGVASLDAPVLVAGGDRDPYTPPDETLALFDATPEPRALWMVEGAAHVDLFGYDPAGYREHVLGFLEDHLIMARIDHPTDSP